MDKVDRRKERTRQWFQDALLALIEERGYENITVQDIVDRANTARVTFYRHYKDKEELLKSCLEQIYVEGAKSLRPVAPENWTGPGAPPLNLTLYRHVAENYRLYQALLCGPLSIVVQLEIRLYMLIYLKSNLQLLFPGRENDPDLDLLANMVVTSSLGSIVWWLDNERPCPVEHLAQLNYQLNAAGLVAVMQTIPRVDG